MPVAVPRASKQQSVWLYNPSLDLIVGCGAWSVPLLLIVYFSSVASTLTWSACFYVLALFVNYPHYMATIYRAYHTKADFDKYRVFTLHITLLVALTVVLSHVWLRSLPWIFTIYLTASPWHYSGQNYGLFMMFARRAGVQPTSNERRALYGAFLLSYAVLLLGLHTGRSADPLFLSLNIPGGLGARLQIALTVAFVACSVFGLSRFISQAGVLGMIPSLTLFATQCVWFLVPTLLSLSQRFQVPQSRYSTGVLAVMHSAQYLWITSYYAKREATSSSQQTWKPVAYFALLVVGGIALFVPGPWLSSRVFHVDFTRSFLLFTAMVNIHHFILDGAIWKLRDGRIASLLLSSSARIAQGAAQTGSRTMDLFRWLAGRSSAARSIRIVVASVLLILGCIDQAHYFFALHKTNLADLERATKLVPYDAPTELHLARVSMEVGSPQGSITAWQYAIEADPVDPAPRDEWLRYLTQQGRFEEAYDLTASWLQTAPKDASLLVNHGILAQQSGHPADAEASWRKAIALDPAQSDADLYLASALEQQGKLEEAVDYYQAFLSKVANSRSANLPPAANVIGAAFHLAGCEDRVNRPDLALRYYRMANTLGVQTGESRLAGIAEAAMQAEAAKTASAPSLMPLPASRPPGK